MNDFDDYDDNGGISGDFYSIIGQAQISELEQFEKVRETIHRVNTYELPEVLGYRVDMSSPGFSSWIEKMTAATKRKAPAKARAAARKKTPASKSRRRK